MCNDKCQRTVVRSVDGLPDFELLEILTEPGDWRAVRYRVGGATYRHDEGTIRTMAQSGYAPDRLLGRTLLAALEGRVAPDTSTAGLVRNPVEIVSLGDRQVHYRVCPGGDVETWWLSSVAEHRDCDGDLSTLAAYLISAAIDDYRKAKSSTPWSEHRDKPVIELMGDEIKLLVRGDTAVITPHAVVTPAPGYRPDPEPSRPAQPFEAVEQYAVVNLGHEVLNFKVWHGEEAKAEAEARRLTRVHGGEFAVLKKIGQTRRLPGPVEYAETIPESEAMPF
jgi:hypothetical protein